MGTLVRGARVIVSENIIIGFVDRFLKGNRVKGFLFIIIDEIKGSDDEMVYSMR